MRKSKDIYCLKTHSQPVLLLLMIRLNSKRWHRPTITWAEQLLANTHTYAKIYGQNIMVSELNKRLIIALIFRYGVLYVKIDCSVSARNINLFILHFRSSRTTKATFEAACMFYLIILEFYSKVTPNKIEYFKIMVLLVLQRQYIKCKEF